MQCGDRTADAHRHDQPQAVAPPPSVEPATLQELVRKIEKGHEFQRVPLSNLAETVRKWVRRVEIDEGHRRGLTTDERQRLKDRKSVV